MELGVGRFCLNCGHRIGAPVPPDPTREAVVATVPVATPAPARKPARKPVREPAPPPDPVRSERTWDPDEDLLPFADEPSSTGLSGRTLLFWLVGAAALVGLVIVLLRIYAVDGASPEDTATDSSSQEAEAGEDTDASVESTAEAAPETVGKATNVARAATFAVPTTAPATTDLDGRLVPYTAAQMHDGIPATAWRMAGDGSGAVITITLRRPTVVSRVGLINGYAKQVSGVNWYPNNRRILTARWGFDDGTTLEQTFAVQPDVQRVEVPAVLTSTVTLTISSVTPPGAGVLGRDYTAISELAITGRRAR